MGSVPLFKLTHLQELKDHGDISAGGIITSEILTAENKSFSLANSGSWVEDIGFKGIKEATDVSVADGRTMTLIGANASGDAAAAASSAKTAANALLNAIRAHENAAITRAPSAYAASATITPTTELVDTPVTLTNGNLVFGDSRLSATEGRIAEVTADEASSIRAANGIFQIDSLKGSGKVVTDKTGQLTLKDASLSSVANAGVITITSDVSLTKGNTFKNESSGTAFLAAAEVAEGGTLANLGTMTAGAVSVGANGKFVNGEGAQATFDSLTARGVVINKGTVTANTVSAASTLGVLGGNWRVQTFAFLRDDVPSVPGDGTAAPEPTPGEDGSHQEGTNQPQESSQTLITDSLYADELDLDGGAIRIAKGAVVAGKTLRNAALGTQVAVEEGGRFAFAYNEASLKNALDAYKGDKDGKAVVALSKDLSFKEGGSLIAGTVAEKKGALNLGKNSLLLVDTKSLHGGPLLSAKTQQALHVEAGAAIGFVDSTLWGNHYILKDFDDASLAEIRAVDVFDQAGTKLATNVNERGFYVTVGSTNIRDKDASFRLVRNFDRLLDGRQDLTSTLPDVRFLTNASVAANGAGQTHTAEAFAHDAGILAETLRQSARVHNRVLGHAAETRAVKGGFWTQGIYARSDSGSMSHGCGSADYDIDTTGFVFGADAAPAAGWVLGAAFSAQRSDVEAKRGRTDKLTSDIDAYGLSLYGSKTFGNGIKTTAGISYLWTQHDFETRALGAKLEGDTRTNAIVFGTRVEKSYDWENVSMTPYVGFDVVHAREDAFTGLWSGQKAFEYGKTDATNGRLPVGLRGAVNFGGSDESASGRFTATVDASVTPQVGAKKASFLVRGSTLGADDGYSGTIVDDVTGELSVGIGYKAPKASVEFSYGLVRGNVQGPSHTLSAKARFEF